MNYQDSFKPELRNIYAAHGRAVPSDAVVLAIWRRVKDYPDAFMFWASAKLQDEEKLPGNVGLELSRSMYPAWCGETGQPRQEHVCCPDCDRQMPGWFYVWSRDERGHVRSWVQRCMCNHDPSLGAMPARSKEHVIREGGTVMPKDFSGGPGAFERLTFGAVRGEARGESGIGDAAKRLASSPALPEAIRRSHAEQLEYAELF